MSTIIQVLVNTLWGVFVLKVWVEAFLEKKEGNRRFYFEIILYLCSVVIVYFARYQAIIRVPLIILVESLMLCFFYKGKVWLKSVLCILHGVIEGGMEFLVMSLLIKLFPEIVFAELSVAMGILLVAITRILTLAILIIFRKIYNKENDFLYISGKEWIIISIIPAFACVVVLCVCYSILYPNLIHEILYIVAVGMVFLAPFVLFLMGYINREEKNMQEQQLVLQNQKDKLCSFEDMEVEYQRQGQLIHDYKNQLAYIGNLLHSQSIDMIQKYIEELTGKITNNTWVLTTNHFVIDVILNSKCQFAKRHGITMLLKLDDLSMIKLEEHDLVVLLSNLLDNAIEACEKLENNKVINITSNWKEGSWFFAISNPVFKEIIVEKGRIKSSKDDNKHHGIGIKNVNDIILKYEGE